MLKVETLNFIAQHDTITKGNNVMFKHCPYCGGGTKREDQYKFGIHLDTGDFHCFRSSCGVKGRENKLIKDFNLRSYDDNDLTIIHDAKQIKNNKIIQNIQKISTRKKFTSFDQDEINYLNNLSNDKAVSYFKKRGISKDIVDKYKIKDSLKYDNMILIPFFDQSGQLDTVKTRFIDDTKPKEKFLKSGTKMILHGMDIAWKDENKTLIVTEGTIDMLSVAQAGCYNVVSVPNGANGMSWVANCEDFLKKYDEIILFTDNENGKLTMLDSFLLHFNDKIISVVNVDDYRGCKDANEILQKYGVEQIAKCIIGATEQQLDTVKLLADVPSTRKHTQPKLPLSIPKINAWTDGGIPLGTLTIIAGKTGEGKSTLTSQIVLDCIKQGYNPFIYSGEL